MKSFTGMPGSGSPHKKPLSIEKQQLKIEN
jgi:hypothetical protein